MKKITTYDPESKSQDLIHENIEKLKSLFPEIVSEGEIDFEVLKEILGEDVIEEDDYYKFTWAGKAQARREANKPSTGTLRPAKYESVNWDKTQNLYIEGDNLEVLKLMQKTYAGKVKMIYIDPPYNTGSDFVYKDNYKDNLKNYQELTGQVDDEGRKMTTNTDSQGRYHSNWLNMMYPRLRLARNILKDDGVIFMSIDNHELENLKKISDEIFGEDNFITTFSWEKKKKPSFLNKNIGSKFEHIIVYSKKRSLSNIFSIDMTSDKKKYPLNNAGNSYSKLHFPANSVEFNFVDQKIQPQDMTEGRIKTKLLNELVIENRFNKNDFYLLGEWRYSQKKLDEIIKNGEKLIISKSPFRPNHIKSGGEPKKMHNLLTKSLYAVSTYEDADTEQVNLFGINYFDYSKPSNLIKLLIKSYLRLDDENFILDFFSGSGTTAHAVMALNAEDGGSRKHIQVQLPESIDEKSEAYKSGYKTLTEIGKERIRRAGNQILKELDEEIEKKQNELKRLKEKGENNDKIESLTNDISEIKKRKDKLDTGFKVFKLDSSNIKTWSASTENLKENLLSQVENIKADRDKEDVLYEVLIKFGIDLTSPILKKESGQNLIYAVGYGALFICLDSKIPVDVAQTIGEWKNELEPHSSKVVFKDTGLDDVTKTNAIQILKQFGIDQIRSI